MPSFYRSSWAGNKKRMKFSLKAGEKQKLLKVKDLSSILLFIPARLIKGAEGSCCFAARRHKKVSGAKLKIDERRHTGNRLNPLRREARGGEGDVGGI